MVHVTHIARVRPDSTNGVDRAVAGLLRHLPAAGVSVEAWYFTSKVSEVEESVVDGIRMTTIPCQASLTAQAWREPAAAQRFLRDAVRDVDLFHVHSGFRPTNAWALGCGQPYVLSPHGAYRHQVRHGRRRWVKTAAMMLSERRLLRGAAALHAVSEQEAAELRSLTDQGRVEVVPNGVDDELLEAPLRQAPADAPFLYLGRLDLQYKGVDLLVEGYAIACRNSSGRLPDLVLAGPDAGAQRMLQELVQREGLTDRVHFVGPIHADQKVDLIQDACALVQPSRLEGLPLAVLEAFALARPVIVTPGTNLASLVRDSAAGWVVDAQAPAIAQGLLAAAAAGEAERASRGRAGRAVADGSFRWSSVAQQMAHIYETLS